VDGISGAACVVAGVGSTQTCTFLCGVNFFNKVSDFAQKIFDAPVTSTRMTRAGAASRPPISAFHAPDLLANP